MQVELDETTPCTSSASVTKKADVAKLISKGEATIVQKSGKSEIWNLFGKVTRGDEVIKDFVACKSCKKCMHSNQVMAHKVLENTAVTLDLLDPRPKKHDYRNQRHSIGALQVFLKQRLLLFLRKLRLNLTRRLC